MRRSRACRAFVESLESRLLLSGVAHLGAEPHQVSIMSQNLLFGGDLTPIFIAAMKEPPDIPAILTGVTQVWQETLQQNFPVRAEALADQIAISQPDLVGLQEAANWTFQPPPGSTKQAVSLDYLGILLTALDARGLHYTPAIVTANFSSSMYDAQFDLLSLTDRNVILVNQDAPVTINASVDGHFAAQLTLPSIGFNENCGWQAVDAMVGGRAFRYINTHLTATSPLIQQAQAAELVSAAGATNQPVILGGDFNSDALGGSMGGPDITPTYGNLLGAGFSDAWLRTHHQRQPGLTWGQDSLLDNTTSTLNERIDLFLTRGAVQARTMQVVNDEPIASRVTAGTPPYWVSDHAGILASFQFTSNRVNAQAAAGDQALAVSRTDTVLESLLAAVHGKKRGLLTD